MMMVPFDGSLPSNEDAQGFDRLSPNGEVSNVTFAWRRRAVRRFRVSLT